MKKKDIHKKKNRKGKIGKAPNLYDRRENKRNRDRQKGRKIVEGASTGRGRVWQSGRKRVEAGERYIQKKSQKENKCIETGTRKAAKCWGSCCPMAYWPTTVLALFRPVFHKHCEGTLNGPLFSGFSSHTSTGNPCSRALHCSFCLHQRRTSAKKDSSLSCSRLISKLARTCDGGQPGRA